MRRFSTAPSIRRRPRADVVIDGNHVELSFYGHKYVMNDRKTMSEVLMKEMENISLDPVKAKNGPSGVSSFLLVDEQENLQVT